MDLRHRLQMVAITRAGAGEVADEDGKRVVKLRDSGDGEHYAPLEGRRCRGDRRGGRRYTACPAHGQRYDTRVL